VAMSLLAQAKDFAVGRVQRGKQSRRSVALVIVRHGGAAAALQRQARLGTVQSLNLTLLVGATRTGRDRLRACDSNTVRCSGLNVMAGAMRIRNVSSIIRRVRIHKGY
jgi:hypothetical protein